MKRFLRYNCCCRVGEFLFDVSDFETKIDAIDFAGENNFFRLSSINRETYCIGCGLPVIVRIFVLYDDKFVEEGSITDSCVGTMKDLRDIGLLDPHASCDDEIKRLNENVFSLMNRNLELSNQIFEIGKSILKMSERYDELEKLFEWRMKV